MSPSVPACPLIPASRGAARRFVSSSAMAMPAGAGAETTFHQTAARSAAAPAHSRERPMFHALGDSLARQLVKRAIRYRNVRPRLTERNLWHPL